MSPAFVLIHTTTDPCRLARHLAHFALPHIARRQAARRFAGDHHSIGPHPDAAPARASVARDPSRIDARAKVARIEQREEVRLAHRFDRGARYDGAPVFQADQLIGQFRRILDLVRHHHHRQAARRADFGQQGREEGATSAPIERGKRLIQQQQRGRRQQRPRQGYAALFSAGQVAHRPIEKLADLELACGFVEIDRGPIVRCARRGVAKIAAHAQVWKQSRVLEHQPNLSLM